ncbi:GntR family transcriptional regulator [Acerihabitans sp. TG2]|uniref:GntR family transcriptional regulator n=1 Tax=Acerihabitans sp. TG2 TaxID=3096008 RepID=UPI002B22C306|nr:GntR family transcriptional regulator [Acerihabitans sp. TG2]MEA9391029.1 GntR family transcriptional regulator [Acerihabitans sp. TG2]
MSYQPDPIEHAFLGSSVYASLRQALITGQLKPNDRLRIRELAAQVGTSVTPVRDAVLQLAREQALEMRTPKDIRVPILTSAQYGEICTLRLELEALGAHRAAQLINPADLQRLTVNIKSTLHAMTTDDLAAILRLNSEFHLLVARSAQMPLLSSFIDRLWMRAGPHIAQAFTNAAQQSVVKSVVKHHQDLLAALRRQDSEAAAAAIRLDIMAVHQLLIGYLASR